MLMVLHHRDKYVPRKGDCKLLRGVSIDTLTEDFDNKSHMAF